MPVEALAAAAPFWLTVGAWLGVLVNDWAMSVTVRGKRGRGGR